MKKILRKIKEKIIKHLIAYWKRYLVAFIFIFVFFLGIVLGFSYFQKNYTETTTEIIEEIKTENIYVSFLSEVYDKIKENYWENISDEQLGTLYRLGIEKLTNQPQEYKIKNRKDLEQRISEILELVKEDKKKEFTASLANLVLINLKPLGRSSLYTAQKREELMNKVQNINPEIDLYKILGVEKDVSEEELEKTYEQKVAELEKDDSEEAKGQLKEVKYAYEVLTNTAQKQRYDEDKIEPTVLAKLVRSDILHLYIKKISPTTLNELKQETERFDHVAGLDTLILDLRSNIGGSIEVLPYLLGPFIGKDQYAFEFLHQEERTPFKTRVGWLSSLVRYKKVVVLIDNKAQSSAEIIAATFKKYNVGILVGTKTRGWGTIELVTNLEQTLDKDEEYSLFLVHSLTLDENGQPIEGKGIEPVIQINDPGWEKQLFAYFHYDELVEAVKEIWNKPPGEL